MPVRLRTVVISLLVAAAVAACGSSGGSTTTGASAGASTAITSTGTTSTSVTATASTAQAASQPLGPEAIPLEPGPALAPASTTTQGATVDGVQCSPSEQVVYHIHSHLQVYVNGRPRSLPGAIGIVGPVEQQTAYGPFFGAQQCYYWLHTHTNDGVIHVESPSERVYTLGNFFDEWRQPLSRTQVASATGKVKAFLNGKPWTRDPRAIPLLPHASIQLDVGSPTVAPKTISWAQSNL
jgi:hypothetical protein